MSEGDANQRLLKTIAQGTDAPGSQPVSVSRAPAADLSPWIGRIHATMAQVDGAQTISCGILADTSVLRILLKGEWQAETSSGPAFYSRTAIFFGPHSRRLPCRVKGDFATVALSLAPGTCHALGLHDVAGLMDRLSPFEELGFDSSELMALFRDGATRAEWMDVLENYMRALVQQRGMVEPDQITRRFDEIAFANPNIKVKDFAKANGIEPKRLERVIKRDFGLPPKQVLRRARALDMAAHLKGVADASEADELALRYFDQSHLNRDFVDLFGMTPTQFVRTPQPLMTLTLEHRQARRLEVLKRVEPDAIMPWQEPPERVSRTES